MRVGIDMSCWANHRGYGRYTRNLLRALAASDGAHELVGIGDHETLARAELPARLRRHPVRQSEPAIRAAAASGRRRLADVGRMSLATLRARPDVVFFPSLYTYFPVLGRARTVVVIHDAIPERWPELVFPNRAGRLAWGLKARLACLQADRVVTVSHASARAIRDHLPVRSDRIRVIYEAADPTFSPPAPGTAASRAETLRRFGIGPDVPVVLYVGGFSPHKDVDVLVEALASVVSDQAAAGRTAAPHLMLVGETTGEVFHSGYAPLSERVRRLGLQRRVTFTGYLPDAELARLYQAATCFVFPSRDEGFGLPVVEAMACGAPVVATTSGALPEVVGEAGLLVEPRRPDQVAAALGRLLSDEALRAGLRERGFRRASEFSWQRAATELLDVFAELGPSREGRADRAARVRATHA